MANELRTTGLQQLKRVLSNEQMKVSFENVLKDNAGAFMASIIELYQSDSNLQQCDPNKVVLEALKAATLKLPINRGLGFAFIVPYRNIPQMQIGYKGIIQLAQRSGQYKYINAGEVYEGEAINYNRITGMLEISGEAVSDKVIGYFAYFQLANGFEKAVYWTVEKVTAHAKKFSRAYQYDLSRGAKSSPWSTNFDAMAIKTVLKSIISKYGPMSVEMANAISQETDDRVEAEVAANANGAAVTIPTQFSESEAVPEQTEESVPAPTDADMEPGF